MFDPGAFFRTSGNNPSPPKGNMEVLMSDKERSYAKLALLSVKDWDAYQKLLRAWSGLFKQKEGTTLLPVVLRKA